MKINGQDKRSRLSTISHLVEDGTVLFPKRGTEKLIKQLVGFGMERHDDLADAFSIVISKIASMGIGRSYDGAISFGKKDFPYITYQSVGNLRNMQF